MAGWIKLHRVIKEHAFFKEKRKFSRFEAWVDLLLSANHIDKQFLLGNEMVTCERASLITSEVKLMDRWGWSKSKVRAFLLLLDNEKMIVKKTDTKKTTITIVKYDFYQGSDTTEEPEKDRKRTAKELQKDTNKNVKNDKNEKKKIYAEFVTLLEEEYEKLLVQFGEQDTKDRITRLSLYKHSTGKKYKSDYATILNWARKDDAEKGGESAEPSKYAGLYRE